MTLVQEKEQLIALRKDLDAMSDGFSQLAEMEDVLEHITKILNAQDEARSQRLKGKEIYVA